MDRLLVASALVAAAGLAALGALAHAVEPPMIALGDAAKREGQRVCLEATLAHLRVTGTGTHRFVLGDGYASLGGWSREAVAAVPGDLVHACGRVQRDGAAVAFVLERRQDLRVERAWDAHAVPVSLLAAQPWEYRERFVAAWGIAEHEGPRTYLRDPTSLDRIPLARAGHIPTGTLVRVSGVITYNADEARFRLDVSNDAPEPGPA